MSRRTQGLASRASEVNILEMGVQRLSIPINSTHVLRDGVKSLVDAKEIVVNDIVYIDSKVSSIVPADIILVETDEGEPMVISSYLDDFDHGNNHFEWLRADPDKLPEGAT